MFGTHTAAANPARSRTVGHTVCLLVECHGVHGAIPSSVEVPRRGESKNATTASQSAICLLPLGSSDTAKLCKNLNVHNGGVP